MKEVQIKRSDRCSFQIAGRDISDTKRKRSHPEQTGQYSTRKMGLLAEMIQLHHRKLVFVVFSFLKKGKIGLSAPTVDGYLSSFSSRFPINSFAALTVKC